MIGHRRCIFQGSAAFKLGRDPGGPERMVADQRFDPCSQRTPAHHGMRIGLRQRVSAQLPGTAPDGAKQRPFQITLDPTLYHTHIGSLRGCV